MHIRPPDSCLGRRCCRPLLRRIPHQRMSASDDFEVPDSPQWCRWKFTPPGWRPSLERTVWSLARCEICVFQQPASMALYYLINFAEALLAVNRLIGLYYPT
ncbi:hypothetical protein BV898_00637 [Hypsibius exemplaris]|uniref:Uncharacterized protein n=1 Tax=Hypsibius exemplaris TaxID=2072580 RepID=A0A1W0XE08_HYPEX|nr:hypothetical protein BV898_00637 [Hypsibius exemplaris]